MGLQELKQEILDKARQQADALVKGAKEEERLQLKEAEKRLKELSDSYLKEMELLKAEMERKESSATGSETKKAAMAAKKEIVEHVFSQARKEISILEDSEREKAMRRLLKLASEQIDMKFVYCRSHDLKFIPNDLVALEKQMAGGLIAESSDRSVRIDMSFDRILEEIEHDNVQEIRGLLFE